MGTEEVRVGDLVLADPNEPERGWRLDPLPDSELQEIGSIPIRMSLTDGVPIPSDRTEAPPNQTQVTVMGGNSTSSGEGV